MILVMRISLNEMCRVNVMNKTNGERLLKNTMSHKTTTHECTQPNTF